jgi:6-phosphofructokinase 1
MDGEGGLLQYVERRLKENKHMVIVVAEGAGQDLIAKSLSTSEQQDASGNKLLLDIGLWLTHKIKVHKTLNFASEFRSAALVNIGN